jgi:hypothetical protein
MKKATTMVALVALLAAFALVLVATQNAAQAHEEQETVDVAASKGIPGFATGVFIHDGDRVVIKATGTVDLNKLSNGGAGCDPDYDAVAPNGCAPPPAGSSFVNAKAKIGALLGSIGQFSNTNGGFVVGREETFTASRSGELYLIVNDSDFTDNSGSFSAEIRVDSPDTTPPRVRSTLPTGGATGVAPFANIRANFSEDMKASTINGTNFKLFKKGSTTKVGATVSYNATLDSATLNPTNSLQRGAIYKAVVTTSAKDEAGNRLDQNRGLSGLQQKVWFFKVSD